MNVNENAMTSASQNARIIEWLERGFSITSLEALKRFGCMRLASRIHDIRERGYEINTRKVKTESGKYVTEYSLRT